MESAWKVGLMFTVFAAMVLGVYSVLQRNLFAVPTNEYFVEFDDAGGLTSGSAVLLSGVRVGQVERVELRDGIRPIAVLQIEEQYGIPEGSVAVLSSSLIGIGDRKIEIRPPVAFASALPAGSTIPGTMESPLASILPDTEKTIDELNNTLLAVQALLSDEELLGGVKDVMAESQVTVRRFGNLAGELQGAVATNSARVGQLMVSVESSLENLYAISEEFRRIAQSGELEGRVVSIMDSLDAAANQGQMLVADMQSLVNDPEMRGSMKQTLSNVEEMSESGTRIAKDVELMAANGVTLSEQGIELMEKANEIATEVKEALEEFRGTIGGLTGAGAGGLLPDVEIESGVFHDFDSGLYRIDLQAEIPIGRERLLLGLYDAFESNKLNLQLQRNVASNLDLRYGVYASKPGIGVNYSIAPRLSLRGDLYGLNDPRLDARLRYDFGSGVIGWFGVDRLFDRGSPILGVGIRR